LCRHLLSWELFYDYKEAFEHKCKTVENNIARLTANDFNHIKEKGLRQIINKTIIKIGLKYYPYCYITILLLFTELNHWSWICNDQQLIIIDI